MSGEIADEYRSSLLELNANSKPHINMLTMLAEENISHAPVIVKTIVDHINTVTPDLKLPSLYLVDSIVKNIGEQYIALFSKHLVKLFSSVFEKVSLAPRYDLKDKYTYQKLIFFCDIIGAIEGKAMLTEYSVVTVTVNF